MANTKTVAASSGVSLGAVIACIASWSVNHSIVWAIIHAVFGWFYVIYFMVSYG